MSWILSYCLSGCDAFKRPSPNFEKWARTTTQSQVHELFTECLQDPVDWGTRESVSGDGVRRFDATLASVKGVPAPSISPDTPISTDEVLSYLAKSNPGAAATLIERACAPLLSSLLLAHAAFPFAASAPGLTRSSLLRAVLVLSSATDNLWAQCAWTNGEETVVRRTPEDRIAFIFASLAASSCSDGDGTAAAVTAVSASSEADVLHVLCRVHYPMLYWRMGRQYKHRRAKSLAPVARRLHALTTAAGDAKRPEDEADADKTLRLPATKLRPLADLVAVLNGNEAAKALARKEALDVKDFQAWATEAQLFKALDTLFICLLPDTTRAWPSTWERPAAAHTRPA